MLDIITALWQTLNSGLPVLLLQFLTTVILLILGISCYIFITPFNERALIAHGNRAAGLVLSGALISIAIPLAATLATTGIWLDIVLWGSVAVVIQLLTFLLFTALFRSFRAAIEADNLAIALVLVGIQLAIAVLNAGAMAG
jgi:putative membrane protein